MFCGSLLGVAGSLEKIQRNDAMFFQIRLPLQVQIESRKIINLLDS